MLFSGVKFIPEKVRRLIKNGCSVIQAATLTSRSTRGEPLKLPKPFPYEKKKFYFIHDFFDPTIIKLSCENAKLIVVEGPIGAGKSAFCKALADEFEMKFFPQPTADEFFLLPSGYDLRQHDEEMPECARTYDHRNFCIDPFSPKAVWFQFAMFNLRYCQYIDALCHILNTGQGAILERSYFSDYVFMMAMEENKFVKPKHLKAYKTVKRNLHSVFPTPHLVIYLDMPVPVVQERIKTRNYSYEQNSPALTSKYLASLEKFMKEDYLKSIRQNSEILLYDWSDGGNIDVVIDDIEKINFDTVRSDDRFRSWWLDLKSAVFYRTKLTNTPEFFQEYFYCPWYNIDEVFNYVRSFRDAWMEKIQSFPETKYDFGYNYHNGDSIFQILFNTKKYNHRKRRWHIVADVDSE